MTAESTGPADLDLRLLTVGRFRCRPDCALCCFATPAASPSEVVAIREFDPATPWLAGSGPFRLVASRPHGGACHFLSDLRCRAHAVRPLPCQEFPVTVHLGARPQASLVLSCPGLDVTGLDGWPRGAPATGGASGLDTEVAAVRREMERTDTPPRQRRAKASWHRAATRQFGRTWEANVESLRSRLRDHADATAESAGAPAPLPPFDGEVDQLPLFHDERHGRVALGEHPAGWAFLAVAPEGSPPSPLGVVPAPPAEIALEPDGHRLLTSYLRYWVDRDAWFGWALGASPEPGEPPLARILAADLAEIAVTVKSRGWARARLDGRTPTRLGPQDIAAGIRATDADYLDRPTVGAVL